MPRKFIREFSLGLGVIAAFALAGLAPAKAVVVSWDLSSPANTNVGTTYTFTSSTVDLYAAGFSFTLTPTTGVFSAIDLFTKHGGGNENGLGIASDPKGQHEIYQNTLVRLDTTAAQAAGYNFFQFSMGSSTNGEGWSVFGSNSANTSLVSLIGYDDDQGVTHNLPLYKYYYFTYDGSNVDSGQGDNVLLHSFAASNCPFSTSCGPPVVTPLPASLPLFASGTSLLGFLGWRRKRRKTRPAA